MPVIRVEKYFMQYKTINNKVAHVKSNEHGEWFEPHSFYSFKVNWVMYVKS